jgi:hypothetical protein
MFTTPRKYVNNSARLHSGKNHAQMLLTQPTRYSHLFTLSNALYKNQTYWMSTNQQ